MQITYNSNGRVEDDYIKAIKKSLLQFDEIDIKTFGIRAGAIDLISIVEIVGLFLTLRVLEAFVSGFINEDFFKNLGDKGRKFLLMNNEEKSKKVDELYQSLIEGEIERYGAIVSTEYLHELTVVTVLNHHMMNKELLISLAHGLEEVYILFEEGFFKDIGVTTIQLYPCKKTNTWDYIMIPSTDAFGNYMDRVYKISENEIIIFRNSEEFIRYFDIPESERYKFLISFDRDTRDQFELL